MSRAARLLTVGVCAVVAVGTAACTTSTTTNRTNSASSGGTGTAGATKHLRIGFFGFAKANSFAQATWAGIEAYAGAHNASATFLDANFDGPTQVSQLQDAITSKRYDVVIVQANDGTAMVNPVKQAVAAGITVVVEFTPVGGDYTTAAPQVPGAISIVDPPAVSGAGLGKLGLAACASVRRAASCKVGYLQGLANFPLDGARTKAAVAALQAGGATVYANLVGGYTSDTGRAAMQNLLQAHPDVDVVIGSSQALEGATPLAKGKKITFVGNGGSTQAYTYVRNGTWYGVYTVPEKAEGAKAAQLGLARARGTSVPAAQVACQVLTTYDCLGDRTTLADRTADYSD